MTYLLPSSFPLNCTAVLLLLLGAIGCNKAPDGESGGNSTATDAAGNATAGASGKNVILLRYTEGSESTEERERGFLETLAKEFPDVKVISDNQYAGTTETSALEKSQSMLQQYQGVVNGVFCVCEPNAQGMLTALKQSGLKGKVKFVGFDSSSAMADALKKGDMHGIVLQDPVRMGYLAVKTMVQHLRGESIETRVVTGEYVATPENFADAKSQELLYPKLFEGDDPKATGSEKPLTIAMIPKGTSHEFWKSVHYGGAEAAKELGNVNLIWKGPLQESDRADQIALVEQFVNQKVDGICLAPLDRTGLVAPVKFAKENKVPVLIFDSALEDPDITVSYVATDNFHGGAMAARRMAELLGAVASADSTLGDATSGNGAGSEAPDNNAPSTEGEISPAPAQTAGDERPAN